MHLTPTFRIRTLAALGGVLLLVSACSSSGASTAPTPAAATPAASSEASGGASEGDVYTVAVASGTIGSFLTGEDGKTLYLFTPDKANTTACTGDCATKWPPFVLEGAETVEAGDGVTGTLATFARPDGEMQVTINGLPLYYFAGDATAGDTTGQGVGGKWFVANPAGDAPVPPAAGATAEPTKAGY